LQRVIRATPGLQAGGRTDMGGDKADISAAESAAGLFNLINSMTMEHSGRFWTWQGIEHPW
jgi:hypothetical protein